MTHLHLCNIDAQLRPFSNERNAVIQVKGEKEVLLFLRELAECSIDLLQIRDRGEFLEELHTVQGKREVSSLRDRPLILLSSITLHTNEPLLPSLLLTKKTDILSQHLFVEIASRG